MNNDKTTVVRSEYISRINRVQDYIDSNLSEEFSLIELSKVARFSPYHFHRIFHSITNETLFTYIQRIRLEKAAFYLLQNKKTPIMKIALDCGFSNQASFAKAFKSFFNMSASIFRRGGYTQYSKERNSDSNMGKVSSDVIRYNDAIRIEQYEKGQKETDIVYHVEVKSIREMKVAYIRHTGPYKQDTALFEKLFAKLFSWADTRNLIHAKETKWLILFHDTPELTDDKKLRISLCMTVSDHVKTEGEFGTMIIPGGKYAIGHFVLEDNQYQDAWNALYSDWLPESGYQPDDRLCFELYVDKSADITKEQYVDIYIPIKPL